MARRIGDDEFALVGGEEAVGDIDGDALLALGGQAVEKQREVEFAVGGTEPFRVRRERGELIVVEQLRFVQQAADQRALAVIDAAAGEEAQQRLLRMRLQVLLEVCDARIGEARHQKYPSCFFFSIDPVESWSMTRPCRSEVVASSISWMIPLKVSASLSMAPVSG